VNVIGAVSDAMIERLPSSEEDRAHVTDAATRGGSAIYAPGGRVAAGPLPGGEGILYADADLARIVPRKIVHDYAGDYNRFDIFELSVNVGPAAPSLRIRHPADDSGPRISIAPGGSPALGDGAAGRLGLSAGPTEDDPASGGPPASGPGGADA
jgi:aliphatic nitrilase